MLRQSIYSLLLLLAVGWFVFPIDASGQNNVVRWSTFDMGFAVPSSSNTKVKSAVGQSFVGTSRSVNNWIDSGFLADTLLRGPVTAVRGDERTGIPSTYELSQNYPNPFNPSTKIKFSVERVERATLAVYTMLGQEVARLFEGVAEPGRSYTVEFSGNNLGSGVYFYRLSTPSRTMVRKMTVLK